MEPGVNVSALARAHGLSPKQVFGWRRKAVREAEAARAREADFALVTVENEAVERGGGLVELVLGEVTVRVGPGVSTERITEIVRAIRAA